VTSTAATAASTPSTDGEDEALADYLTGLMHVERQPA
jgi:hypothetical protein